MTTAEQRGKRRRCHRVTSLRAVLGLLWQRCYPRREPTRLTPAMAIRLDCEPPPDLSGLDVAIRLKVELMRRLATTPPAEWPGQVAQFLAAIDRSALRDTTALLVILAALRAELWLLIGLVAPHTRRPSG